MNIINKSKNLWNEITLRLEAGGKFLPQFFLRIILFWEFWEAGKMKYDGGAEGNWFASIKDSFPFPFNSIDPNISWAMSMWGEILFSIFILLGLFTRFAAFSLIIITVVAVSAVHWPGSWDSLGELWKGYGISNSDYGNYKIPLLYVIMLLPLLFNGAGQLSLDALLTKMFGEHYTNQKPIADTGMWGIALMIFGAVFVFVMPVFGGSLIGLGIILVLMKIFFSK